MRLVREPFTAGTWTNKPRFDTSSFIYFGRVTFAKGVDIFAAVGEAWQISQITFLGRRERMPFHRSDMEGYLETRLHADLHPHTRFIVSGARHPRSGRAWGVA